MGILPSALALFFALLSAFLGWRLWCARKNLGSQSLLLKEARRQESLGTLAGGIAHDFNNILGAILGFGVLLEEDLISQPDLSAMAAQITTAARRGQSIVEQLMSYSRKNMESDAGPRLPVSVDSIIRENISLLKPCIRRSISIHYAQNATDDLILADATQIGQALLNLCINADHAIGIKTGLIGITLDNAALTAAEGGDAPQITGGQDSGDPVRIVNGRLKPGNYIRLKVSDNGSGMTRAVAERIFDPFFTTKSVGHGTGLGLAALEGIVRSHGGAIAVTSTPLKGTSFELYFPAVS